MPSPAGNVCMCVRMYVTNVTIEFCIAQRTIPAQPNGISIDFIDINVANVTYTDHVNDTFVNYTVTMEIVPATCDHVIPTMTATIDVDVDGNYGYTC